MEAAKYRIHGSDYIGVFATATDKLLFIGEMVESKEKKFLANILDVESVGLTISGSELVGLFSRANSKGVIFSNLILDEELAKIKSRDLDMNIGVLESGMNAIGCNILANDKVAIINSDYSNRTAKSIGDILDVEVVKAKTDGFKTVGANNILTNNGFVINNRSTDSEKERLDAITGFDSVRTTANAGSLTIGLSVIVNSRAVVVGDDTTGYELARILEALE